MQLKPTISRLQEEKKDGSTQYVLTINRLNTICPFHIAKMPCSTLCPHFVIDEEKDNIIVTLSCGNGNAYHTIFEVLNLKD
jgi:hypothetical protein